MKKCAYCGIEKEESDFSKNTRNSDGLHSYCKECNKKKAKAFNKTDKGKENVLRAQKKQFESGYFKYGKGAIANMSKSAKHRGIDFALTCDSLENWWKSNEDTCFYCQMTIEEYRKYRDFVINYEGELFEIKRFKKFFMQDIHAKINDMTIDRKDNSKGYSVDNIVKSCWFCNSLKSDFFTKEEMVIVGKLFISTLKKYMEES